MREPLVVLDEDLRIVSANQAFYRGFNTSAEQTVGESIFEIGNGHWNNPKLRKLLLEIIPRQAKFDDFQVDMDLPKIGHRSYVLNARRLEQQRDRPGRMLLAFEDITNKPVNTQDTL